MTRSLSLLFMLLLALGCGDDDESTDATVDAVADATDDAPPTLDEAIERALVNASRTLGVGAGLAVPLVTGAEGLRDGPATDRDARVRDAIEAGVSGNSIVTVASCVTYDWSGAMATIAFEECRLELTDEILDGTIVVTTRFEPTTITFALDDLTVGDATFDGTLALDVGGDCGEDACLPQRTITGNLTVTTGEAANVEITSLEALVGGTGATVSGELVVDGVAMTATRLHWGSGECLPSSGTLAIADPMATLRFLLMTPVDGIVSVDAPPLIAMNQMLFMPCTP